MQDLFKKNVSTLQNEWFEKGRKYAFEINEMVAFGEKNGWENWKGKDPVDEREHLAEKVFELLKAANKNNEVVHFREQFPPSFSPFAPMLEKKSQSIEQLCYIDNQRILFLTGTSYQNRQAYLVDDDRITVLDKSIRSIGKSKRGNVFAVARGNKITTSSGWEGEMINEFDLTEIADAGITELIPFNDGRKLLIVTSEGIYLVSETEEKLIHPLNEDNEEDWSSDIDMENAALSNDNNYIVVGDQGVDHRLLDSDGNTIGIVGPQSSYPHFCLFAKDDSQLITNSCHFYNGVTIGVNSDKFSNLNIEAYSESEDYIVMDEEMRVYAGVATGDYYILGDAYGYIRAFDKNGKKLWRHFLGSTICSIAVSDDGETLWVGSFSGMLHKLQLGKGHRDSHVIGNGNHYEEFRLLIWRGEPEIWKW